VKTYLLCRSMPALSLEIIIVAHANAFGLRRLGLRLAFYRNDKETEVSNRSA
jgi:hypothetical protein